MTLTTVGREAELATVKSFVEAPPDNCSALILEGEPGIGKTTLWREGRDAAGSRADAVLSCTAVADESQLPFAALGDLLEDALDQTIPHLAQPQARALEIALFRADPEDSPPDPRFISVAGLAVLRLLAERGPVVIAIDNVHALDQASYRVLSFAIRRLTRKPVKVLASVRRGERPRDPFHLANMLGDDRLTRVELGPLDVDDLDDLLRERLNCALPRPLLMQVHQTSGGNPFYALELGRSLLRRGDRMQPGETLPVPESLRDLILDRLAGLPATTRKLLLVVSALSQPTVSVVTRAIGVRSKASLERAVDGGILEVKTGRIRFSHPLIRSAVLSDSPPGARREIHRMLAGCVDELEEQARHLALASEEPNAEVAQALDGAAATIRARGAPEIAADFSEMARALTPDHMHDEIRRRSMQAADSHLLSGDFSRAQELLETEVKTCPSGLDRANLLLRLAGISDLPMGEKLYKEALAEGEESPSLQVWAYQGLSETYLRIGDAREAAHHARRALELAEELQDRELLVLALTEVAKLDFYLGRGIATDLLERALALEAFARDLPTHLGPRTILGRELMWAGDLEAARAELETQRHRALDHGDEGGHARILEMLVDLECRAGNFEVAAELARKQNRVATQIGDRELQGALLACAQAEAYLGKAETARAKAEEVLARAGDSNNCVLAIRSHQILGFIGLSTGETAESLVHFELATELVEKMGSEDPSIFPHAPDEIEALIIAGNLEKATRLLNRLEHRGRKLDRRWAMAAAARCHALLLGAQGVLDSATRMGEKALKLCENPRQPPFEMARTLLVAGAIRRRAKQKRPARDLLQQAVEIFDSLGASSWAQKATVELERVGGRAPAPHDLTPTERHIVKLVASGYTNGEIAEALFVSVRTVESNLTKIFRKCNVSSRKELRRIFAAREVESP